MLKYDEYSFQQTAHAVIQLNPKARSMSVPALVEYMKAMAEREIGDRCGYVGTLGFYVTTYTHPSGNGLGAIATLAPSLVLNQPERVTMMDIMKELVE
jgi:hypothetical protein